MDVVGEKKLMMNVSEEHEGDSEDVVVEMVRGVYMCVLCWCICTAEGLHLWVERACTYTRMCTSPPPPPNLVNCTD